FADCAMKKVRWSSGHRQLDDSVVTLLRKWKFRPATTTPVRIPFSFTENGKVELGSRSSP
ncbi:MAG: hypothetical protein DME73_06610, partial [Verrucomicrobia bacterium]